MPVSEVVRRHVILGDCYLLDEARYYSLRAEVASNFQLYRVRVSLVRKGDTLTVLT